VLVTYNHLVYTDEVAVEGFAATIGVARATELDASCRKTFKGIMGSDFAGDVVEFAYGVLHFSSSLSVPSWNTYIISQKPGLVKGFCKKIFRQIAQSFGTGAGRRAARTWPKNFPIRLKGWN
jgi:hypothetical protein